MTQYDIKGTFLKVYTCTKVAVFLVVVVCSSSGTTIEEDGKRTLINERLQNKQLSQVLSIPTSVKEIAKRLDLPFKISLRKLFEI